MAKAQGHDGASQGDSLELASPLIGGDNGHSGSVHTLLGRAPRHPLRGISSLHHEPNQPHTVRLMEVVPLGEDRLPHLRMYPILWSNNNAADFMLFRKMTLDDGNDRILSEASQREDNSFEIHSSSIDKLILDKSPSSSESSGILPLRQFLSKKSTNMGLETSRLPKGIRLFYERQDDLIDAYEAMNTESKLNVLCRNDDDAGILATRMSQISFLINLILMIVKALAVNMSNSLSIISSLVDSIVDLISGIIIWYTSHAIRTTNIYIYPVGRSRLEPVAIIILSVIMSLASLEVMRKSVEKMIHFGDSLDNIAVFELPTLLITGCIVVVKFTLAVSFWLIMKRAGKKSSGVDALIQDHRNDTMSNLVAIICGYLGSVQFAEKVNTRQVAYVDPAGAIVIALYIIISWWQTGMAQLRMITGYTADPSFLSQITWVALKHSPKILKIDTVRAFHFGANFLVEVDIVLSADTILMESHDIGEKLQQKLEKLPRVERAFVHVDYEWDHRPQDEHIIQSNGERGLVESC